jgi:D-glycero-alpha-D-manno-heptose-7-phosphate kinase
LPNPSNADRNISVKNMVITKTPFRISFFGGGTDYPTWYKTHGGAVLSTSINKYCYVNCRKLPLFYDHKSLVVWSKMEKVQDNKDIEHPAVKGALQWLGIKDGVEINYTADLPARAGLGSSSSFVVGLLHGLYTMQKKPVSKKKLALDAIHLEQKVIKESVGSQDQTATAIGGLNYIEFGTDPHVTVTPLSLDPNRNQELQSHCMLFFTGTTRNAFEIASEQIKKTHDRAKELHTMRKLVDDAKGILTSNASLDEFGKLLHETWQIKRGLTSKISNPAIDEIYEAGRSAGALGGKLLGAGGGGFMLFFVPPTAQKAVKEKLHTLTHVPFKFEKGGSRIIYHSPEVAT